ncbi:hypothetical protein KR51_00028700 [Rubidibacter lacunae KORDI 51-2]|uniref:Uncharacterized protein n=1 Tax=Rubidibacter lacunae KORDI 51-2 TaxID=582515 RepID=U5D7N6_9CHRO|nr:DUF5691 domain-containing protein [Rubidibacter lacunae]ERN40613.1 hypothetical protein KR51_00028700 [Rubidibacter lacunae KORDI 51-2]
MSATHLWQQLVKTALVGCDRQSPALPSTDGPLAELLGQLDPDEPERYVLGAAGALSFYRKAGFQPGRRALPAPEPCPADELPRCSLLARELLVRCVESSPELLPEWLALATARGQRVAEVLLPTLLNFGRTRGNLRAAIAPVLGARGRWLAAQNPHWHYAAFVADKLVDWRSRWQTGKQAERVQILRRLRATDSELARDLLTATWKTEKADARASLLETLAIGLDLADEAWLESALSDRSKQVRQVSAALLAKLRGSNYGERMRSRLDPLLQLDDRQIRVVLPDTLTPEMERDGVLAQAPRGIGQKTWWLVQMLGAVPPGYWNERWGMTPDAIARAVLPQWRDDVYAGWAAATTNQPDPAWAQALLFTVVRDWQTQGDRAVKPSWLQAIASVMPSEQQQAIALDLVADARGLDNPVVITLLGQCQFPWSRELSVAFVARLAGGLTGSRRQRNDRWWELQAAFVQAALYVSPDAIAAIDPHLNAIADAHPFWQRSCETVRERLKLRQQLHRAFAAAAAHD